MRRLMDKFRQALGHVHQPPKLTSEAERNAVTRRLTDQRIRFRRMGIEVEVSTAAQSSTKSRPPGDNT